MKRIIAESMPTIYADYQCRLIIAESMPTIISQQGYQPTFYVFATLSHTRIRSNKMK